MTGRRGGALAAMLAMLLASAACATTTTTATATATTTAAATTTTTTTTTAAAPEVAMPEGPWKLVVADGAGNSYVVDVVDGVGTLVYRPVTMLESSSGTYSGGEPASRSLGRADLQTVWSMALAVERAIGQHVAERRMGTIAQRRESADGVSEVIVDGSVGEVLVAWLRDRLKAEPR